MSKPEENSEIPASVPGAEARDVPQPRQPQNLQGLLRFAMEATKAEDAPGATQMGPLDEEKRKFLEEALKSMTVDVMELLHTNVQFLRSADTLSVDSDPSKYMNAFEVILDHIDNLDNANDFHKIGGFTIFQPCFNSVHGCIRTAACDVLAELCQNNPYCQRVVTDNNMIKQLLEIVDKDKDNDARIKAVYAVSCNVRENEEGLQQFIAVDGVPIVLRAMHSNVDKLRTKCAFLLSCLSTQHPKVRKLLLENDVIPLLIGLISQERTPSHEHLLSLLSGMLTDSPEAIGQCTHPDFNFGTVLKDHLRQVHGREECQEEAQYCKLLLDTVFKEEPSATDR